MTDTAAQAQAFVAKWERSRNNERQTAQEHFIDLCHLLGVKTPNDIGASKDTYTFEKPLTKTGGGAGYADVWMQGHFAWEYKTKGKYDNLRAAYTQLILYKGDLGNPPILVVSDIARIQISIEFTGYPTREIEFSNADLLNVSARETLRLIFRNPEELRPAERAESITELAAARFAQVARYLEQRGFAPSQIAPFFMKVLFALFAEDIKLLPAELMSQSLRQSVRNPEQFPERARALFKAMREGGYFGLDRVPQFNGWLFSDDEVPKLTVDEIQLLGDAARLDWAAVEPAIFGTLFERSLDPAKRSQLGAHYTSRSDILLIIEPVLMAPLRREWAAHQTAISALQAQWESQTGNTRRRLQAVAEGVLLEFMERLAALRVLDPASGSGNFLYVALACLKDLEKEVWTYAGGLGVTQPELGVGPAQLFGIEKNPFAAELAQVVVWIGYLQWLKNNGFLEGPPAEPILQHLHNIENRDAILDFAADGTPIEPAWPAADVIVGNPPFVGGNKVRYELGNSYVEALFKLYEGRVPAPADMVCYWFERSRMYVEGNKVQRAGLLATNSIRGGANRKVLERIKQTGNIFMAWSDRPWVLDGAAVRVSMIGFDDGKELIRTLNGVSVQAINSDLTHSIDVSLAKHLPENEKLCFRSDEKGGPFDIDNVVAGQMLAAPINPNGRTNTDVVRPYMNSLDITRHPRNVWIVDFGVNTSEADASLYTLPFEYIRRVVKPIRAQTRNEREQKFWWLHRRPAPDMRLAVATLQRFIATPSVAKYRLFVWLRSETIPDHQLYIFAREDDYFFGVLHSKLHELWSLRMGTSLEDRPRYTPTTTFETFPFPYPPGSEDQTAPQVVAIGEAARALVAARDAWLAGGDGRTMDEDESRKPKAESPTAEDERRKTKDESPTADSGQRAKDRTLTNLYNKRPDWLDAAHRRLDAAVFAAYGWPADLSDEALLERLLALNLERAGRVGDTVTR